MFDARVESEVRIAGEESADHRIHAFRILSNHQRFQDAEVSLPYEPAKGCRGFGFDIDHEQPTRKAQAPDKPNVGGRHTG